MGYYDEHNQTRNDRKQKRGMSWFLPSTFGALIGASAMLVAAPLFTTIDQPAMSKPTVESSESTSATSNVAYNVSTDITKAVEKAQGSVVSITKYEDSFSLGNGDGDTGQAQVRVLALSIKKEGGSAFVVTNNHVIEGASSLEVTLNNEQKLDAKLLGADPLLDLAVLEIDGSKVDTVAEFGSSENLKTGEPAIALGNPLGFLEGSVTQGIVSNTNRSIPVDLDQNGQPDYSADVIQTDASINPGNSGGALINIKGQLIGINSSKIAQTQVEGIGFAIPINVAEPIIDQLETTGEVKRPVMGITPASLAEVPKQHWNETLKLPEKVEGGVVLMGVSPSSPASKAGLQERDVIVKLDDQTIQNSAELRKYLYTSKNVGDKMEVTFYRDGQIQKTTMTLANQKAL